MGRFGDQVVWITGGGSGIGRELALAFAREGADVAVSGRRQDRLEAVAREIGDLGRRGAAVVCDVTDPTTVEAAVTEVVAKLGRIDVAVANAGYAVSGFIESLSAEEWRRQLDVNVVGSATTVRCVLPELRKTQGRMVLIGSVAGFMGAPKSGAYVASKFAIRGLGATLSTELHGSGVTCTTIHPGYVASEIAQVNNQGQFVPEREDRRPAALIWPTDKAARVMIRAIHRRHREYVFTGHGKIGAFLGRHFPWVIHLLLVRAMGSRTAASGE
jgi:NAD(P)-dependent dehydrogenase (short-subunit alcohol dehydrogenase family)